MKNRKALFFDIDGTLFSNKLRQVPQSAVLALKKARKQGNLVFINTGRTWCQTEEIRQAVETDGLCCGCGTYLTGIAPEQMEQSDRGERQEIFYDWRLLPQRMDEIRTALEEHCLDAVLEGVDGCWMAPGGPRTTAMRRIKEVLREGGSLASSDWRDLNCSFSKFCIAVEDGGCPKDFFDAVSGFEVIDRGAGFYECVPQGHSKATAIEQVRLRYGIAKKDVWVFGDSTNDMAMFRYAENAVLMGAHDKELEPYATFLTKEVEEDGIYWAMEQLGLL